MGNKNISVEIKDPNTGFETSYSMDLRLKNNLEKKLIPSLEKKDKDYIICIDGKEGAGKSTLGMQIGKFIDPSLNLSRIVFSAEQFRDAIFKSKKGQVIIYDEAFTGLSSRASLSGINRALVSLMMQMRQKNLCIILVLPTFFLLDKYAALWRAKVLIHVYENKGNRGYFRLYNSKLKKDLYLGGKKDYSYRVRTKFKGRFYGKFALGDSEIEKKYRKLKAKALEETEKNPMTSAQVRYRDQRDIMIYLFRKFSALPHEKIASLLNDYDFEVSPAQLGNICQKFGDRGRINPEEHKKFIKELFGVKYILQMAREIKELRKKAREEKEKDEN